MFPKGPENLRWLLQCSPVHEPGGEQPPGTPEEGSLLSPSYYRHSHTSQFFQCFLPGAAPSMHLALLIVFCLSSPSQGLSCPPFYPPIPSLSMCVLGHTQALFTALSAAW